MTLAIASSFPPDELAGLSYRSMPFKYPGGIVLCTDSRLTFSPGGRRDIGNKVFQIVPGIALVYAGNVSVANTAIERLTKIIRSHHMASKIPKITHVFSNTFRKAYGIAVSKCLPRYRSLVRTDFLVGYYSQSDANACVVQFGSPLFEPQMKTGTSVIGSSLAVRTHYLKQVEASVHRRGSWPGSVMDMAGILSSTLQETIDSGIDQSIGGVPEVVTIDSDGFHVVAHVVLDEELNRVYEVAREGDGWAKKDGSGKVISRTGYPPYGTRQS